MTSSPKTKTDENLEEQNISENSMTPGSANPRNGKEMSNSFRLETTQENKEAFQQMQKYNFRQQINLIEIRGLTYMLIANLSKQDHCEVKTQKMIEDHLFIKCKLIPKLISDLEILNKIMSDIENQGKTNSTMPIILTSHNLSAKMGKKGQSIVMDFGDYSSNSQEDISTMALMLEIEVMQEQRQHYQGAFNTVFLNILSVLKTFQNHDRAIRQILNQKGDTLVQSPSGQKTAKNANNMN